MKNETKHTPTPWSVEKFSHRMRIVRRIGEPGQPGFQYRHVTADWHEQKSGAKRGSSPSYYGFIALDEANAAFIVEACNNYERVKYERDALRQSVEALLKKERDTLRSALEVITHVVGHNSCTDGQTPNGFVVALDMARAALANAPLTLPERERINRFRRHYGWPQL